MKKLYYSISEISKLIDEEQHILRYWEKEFSALTPRKNRAGNRVYSEKDLQIIKAIKHLLRDEQLSVKGANDKLKILISSNFDESILNGDSNIKNIEKNKTNSELIVNTSINEELKKEFISILKDVVNYLKAN